MSYVLSDLAAVTFQISVAPYTFFAALRKFLGASGGPVGSIDMEHVLAPLGQSRFVSQARHRDCRRGRSAGLAGAGDCVPVLSRLHVLVFALLAVLLDARGNARPQGEGALSWLATSIKKPPVLQHRGF